jgi:hypothetical protein
MMQIETRGGSAGVGTNKWCCIVSFLAKFRQAQVEIAAYRADPWREKIEAAVHDKDAISTAALLDLLRAPATTGTARRLAAVMRSLHFIPIKSRRLMPGGRAGNTVTRGWARPVREMKSSPTMTQIAASKLGGSNGLSA